MKEQTMSAPVKPRTLSAGELDHLIELLTLFEGDPSLGTHALGAVTHAKVVALAVQVRRISQVNRQKAAALDAMRRARRATLGEEP